MPRHTAKNTCQVSGSTGVGTTLQVLIVLALPLVISAATDDSTTNAPTIPANATATATTNSIDPNPANSSASAMQNATESSPQSPATSSENNTATSESMTTTAAPDTAASSTTTNRYGINMNRFGDRNEAISKVVDGPFDIGPERRTVFNKPVSSQVEDYAPSSSEARVADATSQFGLDFLNSLPEANDSQNVVISPLSLQCLMNMLLLGAPDNSTTQMELINVLGYGKTELLRSPEERLKAHEAMRNVLDNIKRATHLSINSNLLNTNVGELQSPNKGNNKVSGDQSPGKLAAHLQTSFKANDTPLTQQVNFTLANLILTNKQLFQLSAGYEQNLRTYYDVAIEEFQRPSPNKSASSSNASQIEPKAASPKSKSKSRAQLPLHERVNNWIRNKTHNQIDKLATEADLQSEDLIMVLLNAAHFKGRWLHTFNPKATHEMTFFNNGLEKGATSVSFMRQKGFFAYADYGSAAMQAEGLGSSSIISGMTTDTGTGEYQDMSGEADGDAKVGKFSAMSSDIDGDTLLTVNAPEPAPSKQSSSSQTPAVEMSKEESRRLELTSKINCSVLMLPFSLNDGQELSMVILLPTKKDGLPELQRSLSGPALNEIYRSLSEQQVQVELPKFSFEASHDAKSSLYKMGLKTIFEDNANLDLMYERSNNTQAANRGAKVDKVIHKAKISVDESGAEAAAASMASIVLRNFIRPPTPVFVADHPFLFVIRHNRSNMPLFIGRVNSL